MIFGKTCAGRSIAAHIIWVLASLHASSRLVPPARNRKATPRGDKGGGPPKRHFPAARQQDQAGRNVERCQHPNGGTLMPHTVVWVLYYCSVQLAAFKESTSYGKSNAAVCSI